LTWISGRFFDEISHEWMVKFLEHRIADKRLLRLIRKGLKAGVIEDGRRVASDQGCPQGSVIALLPVVPQHRHPVRDGS
jgi:RNA-directed DNA polymerase